MTDGLRHFLEKRRSELLSQLAPLRAEQLAIEQKIEQLQFELDEVDKAAAAIGMVNGVQRDARHKPKRGILREGTIKDFVVRVLSEHPGGLVALDILAAINEKFGTEYPRTSLSPQLSRLAKQGVLGRRGMVWYLKSANNESDDDGEAGPLFGPVRR